MLDPDPDVALNPPFPVRDMVAAEDICDDPVSATSDTLFCATNDMSDPALTSVFAPDVHVIEPVEAVTAIFLLAVRDASFPVWTEISEPASMVMVDSLAKILMDCWASMFVSAPELKVLEPPLLCENELLEEISTLLLACKFIEL